jgi:UDP-N-acetylglucosamine 4,6-dehydratase
MFKWSNQTILLTGGTGSFGQAFTKYILKKDPPKSLRIYSRDEFKQFQMQQEFKNSRVRYLIGDVRDLERLRRAMYGVTLVIHAAAMKQILASEYNPTEAIKTNILGTMNVLNAGIDAGVERVFGLITDKAVSPVNLYGATKLCMEKLLIQGNSYRGKGRTRISCIRYGNVAGSRGSVIPLFSKQIKSGTVTVTDAQMTRFWLKLEDAVNIVVKSIEKMKGGEVFIPKMSSFKITDLVSVVAPKSKIKYIGIRPGEKLHEDLITIHESRNIREYPNHYLLLPGYDFWDDFGKKVFGGRKVSINFSYNSGTNKTFLSVSQLKELVTKIVVTAA